MTRIGLRSGANPLQSDGGLDKQRIASDLRSGDPVRVQGALTQLSNLSVPEIANFLGLLPPDARGKLASAVRASSQAGATATQPANVAPPSGGAGEPYVVRSGDTLSDIARRSGTTVAALVQANPDITNPDLIFPGQKINMPGGVATPAQRTDAGPGAKPTGGNTGPTPTVTGGPASGRSEEAAAGDLGRINQYHDAIEAAAKKNGIPPEVLAGIISRETNGRNVIGDGGHGHGLTQIDDRSFPQWTAEWKANGMDPNAAIEKGAEVLRGKMDYLRQQFPGMSESDLLRAGVAAYNGGEGAVAGALRRGASVDSVTTGHDYSTDTLSRADYYRRNGF